MPTEIVIEMEEAEIEALQQEYGELLGTESLIKEIVLNDLKSRKDMKSLQEETKILNLGAAKLNSALGQYEQLLRDRIKSLAPEVELTTPATLTVSTSDSVVVDDQVGTGKKATVQVGMDVQRVAPDSSVAPTNAPVTNLLNEGGQALDPKVKAVMDEVRNRNKQAAAQASARKGSSNAHHGGIVASQ